MAAKGERYLLDLWRQAVLLRWGNRCIICREVDEPGNLEAHHVVRRAVKLTRYHPINGVPVHKGSCHLRAATLEGREKVREAFLVEDWDELKGLELADFKQYCQQMGWAQAQFLANMRERLRAYIAKRAIEVEGDL